MKDTQNQKILKALLDGFVLTGLDGLEKFGTMRLAARINDLRKEGHQIESDMVKLPSGKRIARYFMLPETIGRAA